MNNNNNNNNNYPDIILNSGSYDFKIIFEGKNYPHSINLSKTIFRILINGIYYDKIIFISSGHSFAENSYLTHFNIKITKVTNINELFTSNANIFYSVDNKFNDFCLISFGGFNVNKDNIFKFFNQNLIVNSIYKNINIKILENNIIIKNSHNTGESYAKALIDFSSDNYIHSTHDKKDFYTFKINGKIVIICSTIPSGIVIKGTYSKLTKFNNETIDQAKLDYQLKYYFSNIIDVFKSHDLFNNCTVNDDIKNYYKNYSETNSLSIITMMGDSGSSFYTLEPDSTLKLLGINICSCYMIVLSENTFIEKNTKIIPNLYWNTQYNKLCIGKYIIDELHKSCQILQIKDIESVVIKLSNNIVNSIVI